MEQNPYAADAGQQYEIYTEPERTSLAAVFGFILSLVGCCLPIGIIGFVLGVFALIGIGRSDGRVGGRGLAVAAIIIGLLNTLLWGGVVFAFYAGMGFIVNNAVPATITAVEDLEQGNHDSFRQVFTPSAGNEWTDAEIDAFAAEVQTQFGLVVGGPTGIGELLDQYMAQGQTFQAYQGQQVIPIPLDFDTGPAMVVFIQDPFGPPGGPMQTPLRDMHVADMYGTIVRMSDFDGPESATGAPTDDAEVDPEEDDGP